MFATTTPKSSPVLWQGETRDGYTLRLSRSGLAKILSNLKQTGLHNLVQNNFNGSREAAIVRAIAKVVRHATRSSSGQHTQVFTAVGKTRKYQIVTQPIDRQQSAILCVRSLPLEFENEFEGEFEYEYESELWNESEGFNGPRRAASPTQRPSAPAARRPTPARQTINRARAMKPLSEYAQRNSLGISRIAWGNNIITISGGGGAPNISNATKAAWNRMLTSHGMVQATKLPPHNCAEAHLWLTLVQQGQTPKNVEMWVVKSDKRNRTHEDSPCPNCQQWVRKEFKSVNAR